MMESLKGFLAKRLRLKVKLKEAFRRGRGRNVSRFVKELKPILLGWIQYFRLSEVKGIFEELDGWKRSYARARNLMRRGLGEEQAWRSATNGRGP